MTKLFSALIGLGLLAFIAGCTSPTSNPPAPPVPKKDGELLDRAANVIPKRTDGRPWKLSDPSGKDTLDWIIEAGRTVTIEPGAEIIVDGLLWIDVQGRLIANGTSADPIKFTTAFVDQDFGQWRGIKIQSQNQAEQSEFRNCIFTYGAYFDIDTLGLRGQDAQNYKGMLAIRDCSPIIERCVVFHNQNNAVFISGSNSRPRVRYNLLTDNDASAVRADTTVNLDNIDVSYNCVADNSSLAFIMGFDSSRYGYKRQVNANLDSCDVYYNIELSPLMIDPFLGNFALQSCSPCIDAGPSGIDLDFDGTRADLSSIVYVQGPEEIRGVLEGFNVTLNPSIIYRMSCNLRVNLGQTLTIPAGTRIEATGLYKIEVFGRLLVQGTESNPVHMCPCAQVNQDVWSGMVIHQVDSLARRPGPWYQPSVIQYCNFEDYQQIDIEKPGVQFEGCRFERGYFYGAFVNVESKQLQDTVSFKYCDFINPGTFGIRVVESPVAIRNCSVQNSKGRGISISRGGVNSFVTNCVVQTCSTSGIVIRDFAHTTLVNNTVRNCGYYGLQLTDQSRPLVLNNIVTDCNNFAIYSNNSAIPFVDYCDFFNNNLTGNPEQQFGPPGVGDTVSTRNSITTNPLFVGDTDSHLNGGSPCIDSGDPRPVYNDANGSRNDMGAYGGPNGGRVGRFAQPRNRNLLVAK